MRLLFSQASVSLTLAASLLILPVSYTTRAAMLQSNGSPAPDAPMLVSTPGSNALAYKRPPLRFEINAGQTNGEARFIARTKEGTLFLTPSEAVLKLSKSAEEDSRNGSQRKTDLKSAIKPVESASVRLRPVGPNPKARVIGLDKLPGVSNYLIGNDPRKWRTNVASYAKVKYENLYPGIDLIYYGNEAGQLEYDFKVAPGADPNLIALSIEGANKVETDQLGDLILTTSVGRVRQHAPRIYQEVNGSRREIAGRFRFLEARRPTADDVHSVCDSETENRNQLIAFAFGDYDRTRELVIDPQIVYSTLLGGANGQFEAGKDIAVDADGNAYVVGETQSSDFPIKNAMQGNLNGSSDAFVTKLGPDGTLLYSTFFGGNEFDSANGIILDAAGAIYLAGNTGSRDFPTKSAFQDAYGGGLMDGFVTKLNPSATAIVYSSFLGGNQDDQVNCIGLDSLGHAFVAGGLFNNNGGAVTFPLVKPVQDAFGGGQSDAFVSVIALDGSKLLFSTFYDVGIQHGGGPTKRDIVSTLLIAPDDTELFLGGHATYKNSNAQDFIAGRATSENTDDFDFEFMARFGWPETFVDFAGVIRLINEAPYNLYEPLDFASYITGLWQVAFSRFPPLRNRIGSDQADISGVVALAGRLCHPIPPATTCDEPACVVSLGEDLNVREAINVGVLRGVVVDSVASDSQGAVYILGDINVRGLQTVDPIQASLGGSSDCALVVLKPRSYEPIFVTYFGGDGDEAPYKIAVDRQGNIYLTGNVFGAHAFPTSSGALQTQPKGVNDGFVVKLSPVSFPTAPDFTLGFDSPTITGQAGTKAKVTVNISRTGGFTGEVTVTPPPKANGIKAKPPDPITTTDSSVTFKMKLGAASPGSYPLTFTGTDSGGRTRTATVTLNVE